MKNNILLSWALLLSLLLSLFSPLRILAQEASPPAEVLELIEKMTPEERVGQLFLISFEGTGIESEVEEEESALAAFLAEYAIGGVVLRRENGNFSDSPERIDTLYQLIADLQKSVGETANEKEGTYIPLLVGISQEKSESLGGLSAQPNPMAISATWNLELSEKTGHLLGSELTALGINLYLGPSLDILEDPNHVNNGDLGTRSFGGNPYWVSEMGQAFISGLHSGSEGKILVVAKHFPGRGNADRSPQEEIVTIRKTLEELKEVELAPFSAVSGSFPSPENIDGLLISHIRYEGFQGNIRPTTRPISLDEKSLTQILDLAPFADWRSAGGIIVSDDLGSRAIRDFYAPGDEDFFAHLVARDAFLAGNDLLYLGNILSSDSSDTYTSIAKTLTFFTKKYNEDTAFAARVDAALMRILTQKFRLYPSFSLSAVRPSANGLEKVGNDQEISFEIAQNAATLLSPDIDNLDSVLPAPPALEERMIFITDTQNETHPTLSSSALPEAVLRLYGEGGGGEVVEINISDYSFEDFLLSRANDEDIFFESNLRQADWVVISLASPESLSTLRQLFAENQTVLREKKVILFSFTAPYTLDATDISKLTAYYGLYHYTPSFVDVAARLLFKELTPIGAAPVSISGIGYDLDTVTQPAPEQLLTLNLALPLETSPTPVADAATPAPTAIPMFKVGDTLAVRTGAILDHNGNFVPDGTVVTFSLTTGGESGVQQLIETQTSGGIARADFQLDQTGLLDIRVASGKAIVSETLRLDISDEGIAAAVTIIPPASPEASTPTPAITSTPTPNISPYLDEGKLRFGAWLLALSFWAFGAWMAYLAGKATESTRWGLRWALSTFLGGLIAYNYLALELPAAKPIMASGISSVIVFVLFGELAGWAAGWIWLRRSLGE
ncbi:MAG: hypothetical protein HN736_13655 [Anaerolineae bacterium]|jgi:beta-N-acetylhexosaminidase|nr:hypothetical protein [Anaerolineae bacterium]MBT3712539.1 hypothetical protein [Anaerolineae bacterium]MBT4310826.1 hypothetical protein [Anaerolineae bacterium]MBT4458441.1 hypothetical protein [Anaerolineae bacterium]MBT4841077.1 hypothetical protein [Anaerolineae bacterium]